MVYQMAKEFATRRYQLTINNPKEHGYDHNTIKAILAKGAKLLYWCMCDEEGKEETYHTHLYLVFYNAVMFKTLKNKFPTAHIEVPQWGTNSENYAYIRKEGTKYHKDANGHYEYTDAQGKVHVGTNFSDTFEESGDLPPDAKQGDADGEPIISASVQSLVGRLSEYNPYSIDTIIIDEAHHSAAPTYRKIFEYFKNAVRFGFTATSVRGDGIGLAVVFKEILCEFNTLYGIEHGYLSPIDACQVNLKFDLGTVQYREDTGDYDAADIARVMSGTAAGIAEAYTKNARGQTIIFAPSIEEGKNVTALLNSQHGASTAAFIDGTTQNRGHFLEAYRLGLIKVLVCYAVLTEGVDLPMTETVVLARPIARTNVGLYAQMVGRGLRLYPGKASCKVIDCVGVSNMPICTAATLIGKDVPAPKPEKEPTEKLPEEQDPIKVLEGNEIPDSWIKNQKEVNVMALGEGYTTHDVAWLDVKGGGRILPLPNVVYRISKPLPNGMVYLRKNKKCSRCAVPLQFVLDYVYQDLKQNHPQQQHIWDKKQRYKWDRQPITSEQISLIHKLAPDYKIDTKKMTRGDASRVIQLLAYAPKEQDAQEQAQEVQDDAT